MSISPRFSRRSLSALVTGHRRARRSDGLVDRNTSPTDLVLRDYRYIR